MKNWYSRTPSDCLIPTFTTKEHRWLSNMWPAKLIIAGIEYNSSENAYQAFKYISDTQRRYIAKLTPAHSKHYSKENPLTNPLFEARKVEIMRQALYAKFTQNPDLRDRLTSTGDLILVEGNWWGDLFWGVNKDTGLGQNNLGVLLMEVRSALRDQQS